MTKSTSNKDSTGVYVRLEAKQVDAITEGRTHVIGPPNRHIICRTDTRGYATRLNRSPLDIVVDASEGFIPLWAKDVVLRWRFQAQSLSQFANPDATKSAIRTLMAKALLEWGGAAPVKFSEREDAWDFEVAVKQTDDCDINGCTLASSFFPDAGRHELLIFPRMFQEPATEQVETLAHEFGHVFGLRHFFAQVSEKEFPSVVFGKHHPFSIMNYGAKSKMTANDRSDLKRLYEKAWSGELKKINGTAIRLVQPFHTI